VLRGKAVPRTPSRFLLDVPAELLQETQVADEAPTSVAETAASAEAILAILSGGARPGCVGVTGERRAPARDRR
jgi:hypothetical protein